MRFQPSTACTWRSWAVERRRNTGFLLLQASKISRKIPRCTLYHREIKWGTVSCAPGFRQHPALAGNCLSIVVTSSANNPEPGFRIIRNPDSTSSNGLMMIKHPCNRFACNKFQILQIHTHDWILHKLLRPWLNFWPPLCNDLSAHCTCFLMIKLASVHAATTPPAATKNSHEREVTWKVSTSTFPIISTPLIQCVLCSASGNEQTASESKCLISLSVLPHPRCEAITGAAENGWQSALQHLPSLNSSEEPLASKALPDACAFSPKIPQEALLEV